MANFRTHLAVGTVASGLLASLTTAAAVVTTNVVISLTLAGALGSVLPDIDLQRSRSSRIIFFFLALFLSFCFLFAFSFQFSILEMWVLWIGVFVFVGFIGQFLFHKFAKHRGVFHSMLAALVFAFLTAIVFYQVFDANPVVSWLAGSFMLFGYFVHLCLDEVYSVDFDNQRVKRSFGTALKLIEHRSVGASTVMGIAAVGTFLLTPPMETFFGVVGSQDIWIFLWEKMLPPDGHWFGIDDQRLKDVATQLWPNNVAQDQMVDTMPTGSITEQKTTR